MNIADTVRQFFKQDRATVISSQPRIDPWAAYQGDFPRPLLATKTDPKGDDNILLPLVQEVVNASTSHLLGDGPKLDIKGDGQEAAQAWLDDFLSRSKLQTTLRKAALNGAVIGHIYLKLLIRDGKPDRFQVIGSSMVMVATDPRDCEQALSYTVRWEAPSADGRRKDKYQEVTERGGDGGWTITEAVSEGGSGRYQITSVTEWPFSWPPVFDAQNLTNPTGYLGYPDASDATIAQNESVNTVLSLLARLLRNHSNPKSILTGLNGRKMEWLTDGAVSLPEGVTASQLEMGADGAAALLDLYRALRDEIHTLSRTPAVASGKLNNVGPISGAALQILYKPLDAKTGEKRAHLGEMLESLCEKALEIAGFPGCDVECVWPDSTPRNTLEQRQVMQIDGQLGIASRESLAKQAGYDFAVESDQMDAEGVNAGENLLSALNHG